MPPLIRNLSAFAEKSKTIPYKAVRGALYGFAVKLSLIITHLKE